MAQSDKDNLRRVYIPRAIHRGVGAGELPWVGGMTL